MGLQGRGMSYSSRKGGESWDNKRRHTRKLAVGRGGNVELGGVTFAGIAGTGALSNIQR